MNRLRILLVALVSLTVTACSTAQRLDAAGDVHALLISIRDDDQQTFDAHVDRVALKEDLQSKLEHTVGRNSQFKDFAALLGPTIVDFAGETLLQPQVFKQVAARYGYNSSTRIPSEFEIAAVLKPLPDGRVCATTKKHGPCVLMFTKEQGVWKLTSFEGDISTLRLKL